MLDDEKNVSPSAFIPFCSFGMNMSAMGDIKEPFELPVCNSFKAKNYNDQLCYEVDLNIYKNLGNTENDIKSGLALFLDYNEDMQNALEENVLDFHKESFIDKVDESDNEEMAFIYLNTIGKYKSQEIVYNGCLFNSNTYIQNLLR